MDLLVVMHTAYWMQAYQAGLALGIRPHLVDPLLERGVDVRIGVLSADLGSAGAPAPAVGTACGEPCDRMDGSSSSDEGRLLNRPDCWRDGTVGDAGGCADSPFTGGILPPFLDGDDELLDRWLPCLLVRRDGCMVPQPLESLFQALETGRNPGFLRTDAVLVVVAVADVDDCSVRDSRALADDEDVHPVGFTGMCAYRPEYLHPVSRYADRLLAVRPAERLVVAVFAGADQEYRWCTPGADPAACGTCLPDYPRLCTVSCPSLGEPTVLPAPRLHEFARALGTTRDGWPVGLSWSSCALLASAQERFQAIRDAVLRRLETDR